MEGGPFEEATIGQVTLVCECGRRSEIRVALMPDGSRAAFSCPLLPVPKQSPLSAFETEVLQHIAAGHTDRETASELDVSVSSVRNAVRAAIAHLSTRNRPEAIFRAVSSGYLAMVTGPRAVDAGPRKVPSRLPQGGSHKVPHRIA